MTLSGLIASYIEKHVKTLRIGAAIERRLMKNVLPVIGTVTVAELHRRDINRVIDPILARGAPVEAARASLSFHVSESQEQTRAVMDDIAGRAATTGKGPANLAVWHDLQRWIALGPTDAVIPFAPQIAEKIPPSMVRFRRDVGSLFCFIKASAILHQAQRQVDDKGNVIATLADYRVAYAIFSKVLAETSGRGVTENVRAVVDLIVRRAAQPTTKPSSGRFTRDEGLANPEVVLSCRQIGTETGIGPSAAQRAVRSAIDLGYLVNNETRRGKPYRLVVRQHINDEAAALLPHPDKLAVEGGAP
jgi:hypothetical protein